MWLDSTADSLGMSVSKLRETVKDRGAWCAAVPGLTKSRTRLSAWAGTLSSASLLPFAIREEWTLVPLAPCTMPDTWRSPPHWESSKTKTLAIILRWRFYEFSVSMNSVAWKNWYTKLSLNFQALFFRSCLEVYYQKRRDPNIRKFIRNGSGIFHREISKLLLYSTTFYGLIPNSVDKRKEAP